ncbi:MAG: sensor histidine kinase [Bryobacterales bacterium]|nr:sensor histidine kinase [Bryobacterales bacterium]
MMPRTLRSRLIVASLLWTAGLLALMHMMSIALMRVFPGMMRLGHAGPTLAGVAMLIAGAWAARASLAPLRGLREKVQAVRSGEATRIGGEYPEEVQPLIDNLNALLEEREKAVQRAYATAGDLAHGLKTPLALLSREPDGSGTIAEQVRRMASLVDYHLARARAAASAPAGVARCAVRPCAEALMRTIAKLYAERELELSVQAPPDAAARVRQEDFEEMLGNVLDNACKWARGQVTLEAAQDGARLVVLVDDDGPGLAPALRRAVLERGVRADEAAPGSGLGLAIVRDLALHYGGEVALEDSPLGGLRVRLNLPPA